MQRDGRILNYTHCISLWVFAEFGDGIWDCNLIPLDSEFCFRTNLFHHNHTFPFIWSLCWEQWHTVLETILIISSFHMSPPHSPPNSWPFSSAVLYACMYWYIKYIPKHNPQHPYHVTCMFSGLAVWHWTVFVLSQGRTTPSGPAFTRCLSLCRVEASWCPSTPSSLIYLLCTPC